MHKRPSVSFSLSKKEKNQPSLNLKSQSAMGKRGGKRPRLGYSPSDLSRKVGIVCHSRSDDDYEVKLYVVDVDQPQPNILNSPAVRFVFPVRRCIHAVCVLKSTVYMFWGYDPLPIHPDVRSKKARKFSLSNSNSVNIEVKEKQLDRITPMNFPKAFPVALPTPNGDKILVFPGLVLKDTSGAFELFDPESCNWETLPGLPYKSYMSCCHGRKYPCTCHSEIRCYSFADEFRFYVEYEHGGGFILDLKEKSWKSLGILKHELCNFVTTNKDQYALTAEGMVYPLDGRTFLSSSVFPLSNFPPPNTPPEYQQYNLPSIVSLGEDEQVCETAILQIETDKVGQKVSNARLLLDVCRTKLKEPFSTTVSNTVRLRIDFLEDLDAIVLVSL